MAYPSARKQQEEWLATVQKTGTIAGLSDKQVKEYLKENTHSEIRSGHWHFSEFIMGELPVERTIL